MSDANVTSRRLTETPSNCLKFKNAGGYSRQAVRLPYNSASLLVPKLSLGTHLSPKLCFAGTHASPRSYGD